MSVWRGGRGRGYGHENGMGDWCVGLGSKWGIGLGGGLHDVEHGADGSRGVLADRQCPRYMKPAQVERRVRRDGTTVHNLFQSDQHACGISSSFTDSRSLWKHQYTTSTPRDSSCSGGAQRPEPRGGIGEAANL